LEFDVLLTSLDAVSELLASSSLQLRFRVPCFSVLFPIHRRINVSPSSIFHLRSLAISTQSCSGIIVIAAVQFDIEFGWKLEVCGVEFSSEMNRWRFVMMELIGGYGGLWCISMVDVVDDDGGFWLLGWRKS
jgi:hypothetical protein